MSKTEEKSNFIEERLIEGEEVIAEAEIHNGIFWQSGAVFLLSLLFFIFVAPQLGMLLFVVTLIMAGVAYARKVVLLLVLTNKRVLVRYGIFQMDVVDLHFDKLESIELERMPTGMAMGYSRVAIQGTGNRYISIPYVSNGAEIRKAYNEIVL